MILQLRHEPVALVLTRQALPTLDRTKYAPASGLAKGAYVLADAPGGKPEVLLLGDRQRGRAVRGRPRAAAERGRAEPRGEHAVLGAVRATSRQEYRDSVLPPSVTARVSVEQASTLGLGALRRLGAGAASACARSAPRPRSRSCRRSSASSPSSVVAAAKEQLAGGGR